MLQKIQAPPTILERVSLDPARLVHNLTNAALFIAIVVVPVLVIAVYEALIASDRYESTATMIITEERPAATSAIDLSLLGLPNSAADKDALVVQAYAESGDMLTYLDRTLGIRAHYADGSIDMISRLSSDASFEDFLSYFNDYLTVSYDSESKLLTIAIQAFDAAFAKAVLDATIARSQEFIDRLNDQVSGEQIRFFENELARAETKLRSAKAELVRFQQDNRIYSTEGEGETIMSTITGLEQELARTRSELSAKLTVLPESSPQIQSLETRIAALEKQIAQEKQRLSGTGGRSLSEIDSRFREIQLNLEFLSNAYKSTLSALEQARIEASRKLKFLIVVTTPSIADESEYPDRPYIVATAALICLMVFGIVSLIIAIIREHA